MQATAAAIIINGKKYLFCGFRKGFPASANTCCRFVRIFGACSKRFCARRAIGHRHQPNGFSRGKKLVACFLKLVARISKSEPLIFSLLPCGQKALKTGSRFSVSFFIRFTYRQRRFSFPPNSTRCFLLIAQKSLKWLHCCNLFNDFPAEFCAHKGIAPAPAGG